MWYASILNYQDKELTFLKKKITKNIILWQMI